MSVSSQTTAEQHDAGLFATRPRVRRDVLYTQVPEGVLFHDAKTGFRLHGRSAYRFATLVVPHLDGSVTVSDLCKGLGETQRAMVENLVRSLYQRGFARAVRASDPTTEAAVADAVRGHFAAQIAYVDHHVDDAEDRFARWRDTRVAIVGYGEVARWAALSLLRNGVATIGVAPALLECTPDVSADAAELRAVGCPVELRRIPALGGTPAWSGLHDSDLRDFEFVVVTPGGERTRDLLGLVEAGVPAGVSLLPVWHLGGQAVIGPLMQSGTTGCWVCAALRLGGNADAAAAADLWSRAAGLESVRLGTAVHELRGPLAAMVGNLLGYEIFRIRTGCLPPETVGKVIVQDVDSLDVAIEPLRPHPACPHCAPRPTASGAGLAQPSASATPGRPLPEPGTPESEQQLTELSRRTALVGRHAGVFRCFDDDMLTQTPLRVSTVEVGVGPGLRRRIAAFDVHNVAGARLAALAAAAAVYAEHVVPPVVADPAPAESAAARVRPQTLATASGLSAERPDLAGAWVAATSLATGEPVLVPAAAVAPHSRHNDSRAFVPCSAGLGVDATPEQARGAALLSALGHDALRAALHGAAAVLRVRAPWDGSDAVLTFLARTADNLGVEVDLLELGAADEQLAPVLLARGTTADGDALWAAAADTSWRAAAVAALRDLLGRVQLGDVLPGGDPVDAGEAWVRDLAPQTLAIVGEVAPRPGLVSTLPEILGRARRAGVEPLAVDLPTPDLASGGLSVCRVLVRRCADDH